MTTQYEEINIDFYSDELKENFKLKIIQNSETYLISIDDQEYDTYQCQINQDWFETLDNEILWKIFNNNPEKIINIIKNGIKDMKRPGDTKHNGVLTLMFKTQIIDDTILIPIKLLRITINPIEKLQKQIIELQKQNKKQEDEIQKLKNISTQYIEPKLTVQTLKIYKEVDPKLITQYIRDNIHLYPEFIDISQNKIYEKIKEFDCKSIMLSYSLDLEKVNLHDIIYDGSDHIICLIVYTPQTYISKRYVIKNKITQGDTIILYKSMNNGNYLFITCT